MAEKDIVPISAHSGITFYTGNNPNAKPFFTKIDGLDAYDVPSFFKGAKTMAEKDLGRELKCSEVSSYWFNQATDFIFTHPLKFLKLLFGKFLFFFNTKEIYDVAISFDLMRQKISILNLLFLRYVFIVPFAFLGIYLSFGRNKRTLFLTTFVLSYMFANILFMINSRYRLPVIPVFILFAAYAITRIYESIKLSSPKILLYITIILFSLGLVVLPLESVVGKSEKKDVLITALSFLKAKKYDEAEKLLKELIENDSQYIVAYNQLGNVYMRKGEIEKAESILKKGISLNSRTPSLYDSLGVIYTDKSMLIEAVKQFKKAVQLMPNNAEYRYHLGFALLKKGQLDAGIKEVKKAVEIIEKPIYYNTLGIAYMQKGQKKQAVECWNRAIELDEDFKPAKDNLNRY